MNEGGKFIPEIFRRECLESQTSEDASNREETLVSKFVTVS